MDILHTCICLLPISPTRIWGTLSVLLINLSTDLGQCQTHRGAWYIFVEPVSLRIPGDPKYKVILHFPDEVPSSFWPNLSILEAVDEMFKSSHVGFNL